MKVRFVFSVGNFSYAVDERVTVRKNLVTGDLTYITPENCSVSRCLRIREYFSFPPLFFLTTCVYFMYIECGGVKRLVHPDQISSHNWCRPDRGRAVAWRIGNANILFYALFKFLKLCLWRSSLLCFKYSTFFCSNQIIDIFIFGILVIE